MERDDSTTELGSSERLTINERQQDRIAISVGGRGSKPDQLASMYEDDGEDEQYLNDLP